MTTQHMNQRDLARRWNISPRTLERWRWLHMGPSYIRVGGRICYRLEDVEAYEEGNLHEPEQIEPRRARYAGAPK